MSENSRPLLFSDIVRQYTDYVYGLSYRLLGDSEDAKDVTQEVFAKIHRYFDRIDPQKSLKNWVCTITVNSARDYYRSNARHKSACVFDESRGDGGNRDDSVENRLMVETMLNALEGNYRTAIVLFYIEQKSIKEIAQIAKRPEPLIKVWLHRARKMLLNQFGKDLI